MMDLSKIGAALLYIILGVKYARLNFSSLYCEPL